MQFYLLIVKICIVVANYLIADNFQSIKIFRRIEKSDSFLGGMILQILKFANFGLKVYPLYSKDNREVDVIDGELLVIEMFNSLFLQCRLIICQMSSQPCELFNLLLLPLSIAVGVSLVLPAYEKIMLYVLTTVVCLAQLHYGVCVVSLSLPLSLLPSLSFPLPPSLFVVLPLLHSLFVRGFV